MKPKEISILFIGISLIALSVVSCKKDDDNASPSSTVYPNYSQLKTGNYWIYQQFVRDSAGNATPTSVVDSCYIEKDTLINNVTFYKMIRPSSSSSMQTVYFLRDSLDYTVTSNGKIFFSSQDFTSLFSKTYILLGGGTTDTVCRVETKMADKDWIVSTPAGTFQTSNMKNTYYMYPNWSGGGSIRAVNLRCAKDVGIVCETLPFYASDPNYIERKLIRYHLN